MSREEHNTVGYVVALVSEFATKFGVMPKQAYGYLKPKSVIRKSFLSFSNDRH